MTKAKTFIIIACILLVITVLAAIAPNFIAIENTTFTEAGGCLSVIFDKKEVLGADKLVFRDGEKTVTVTDKKLVKEIASEFVVANRTALCGYYDDKWLEIYNGDKLVRNIHWNDHEDLVVAYERDATHWVLFGGGIHGQIQLTDELVQKIDAILSEN